MINYKNSTRIKTFYGMGADSQVNMFIMTKSAFGDDKFGIIDIIISADGETINVLYWEQ